MSLPARWPFAWSRSPWGASGRSRSPEWASSRSRSPQEASGWSRSRSRSPQWASDWRRPPQWASSRSQTGRESSGWRRSSQGGFSRSRSSQGGSSRSRPAGRGRSRLATSSRSKTPNGTGTRDQPSKRSPSPQGATSRSPSPQGATSRSPSPQGATSRSPSPQGSCSDRSRSPQGAFSKSWSPQGALSSSRSPRVTSSRSRSPRGASSRSRSPRGSSSRSRSPRGSSSRSRSPRGTSSRSRSPRGTSSRSQSPRGAPSRSRSQTPRRASSRSRSPRGALSRSRSPRGTSSRSQSPRGASSRSPSPQEFWSRSPSSQGVSRKCDDRRLSPSVTENVMGASSTSTGADVDPGALSSHEPPHGLYGVKVSNFAIGLKNMHIKSFLTKRFIRYGNVFSVTVCGSGRSRYVLVFYTQKHEQENAMTADTTGPHGINFRVTIWSGPSPSIFGIMITNIDGNDLDLHRRITCEFGIFGDITFVQICGSTQQRLALVFYRYQKGQEKALASPKPFKTSFGKVTLLAWNKPPPTLGDIPSYDISSLQGAITRSPFPQGQSSTRSPSPQGAFSRSPSPHGPSSRSFMCRKIINVSNSPLSPLVPVHQSKDVVGASMTSPGGDVQPTTLPSCEPPSSLYGVKVSNFAHQLRNKYIKSFFTERFKAYGNVFSVTVHSSDSSRYLLVFYTQKHEQKNALTADSMGPLGIKCKITTWSGRSPSLFGIMITNIDGNELDLRHRITSEFGIFGDIIFVQICGSTQKPIALVFYKFRTGQQNALASPNQFKTSLGKVTVYAWNKAPPALGDMPIYDISSPQGPSSRSPSPQRPSSRSLSLQGPSSSSASPYEPSSRIGTCPKISNTSNSQLSPLVPVNQNNENVAGASTTPTGADARSLYGVKVSNFENDLKSKYIQSFLTHRFQRYGNVSSVTVYGGARTRYALVFYKQKHEQEKALTADTKGPREKNLSIAPWSGPPPCTFGIMVTNIDESLLDETLYEFRLFGDVTLVQMLRKRLQTDVLVFYKDRKGQEKALSSKSRIGASFGNVTLHAWNDLPASCTETSKWCTVKAQSRHGRNIFTCSSVSENRRLSHLPASTRIRTSHSRSRSPCSSVSENRRRPHLSASTRIRTRRSMSRSPCSSVSENRRRPRLSASTRIRTRHSRSRSPCSSVSTNLSSRTRRRYSRCQSPHSNLPRSQSRTRRYSRSRSPCSYQLSSEHWHMDKRVLAQSLPLRDHRRVGLGDVTSSCQKSSLILWINNIEETVSSAELHAAFKPFGEIEHIEIKEGFRNNGKQAFLQYNSLSSVTRAIRHMDGAFLLDRKLQVDFAYTQQATNCL